MGLRVDSGYFPRDRYDVPFNTPLSTLDKRELVLIRRASGCNGCALNSTRIEDSLNCDSLACNDGIFIMLYQYLDFRLTGEFQ